MECAMFACAICAIDIAAKLSTTPAIRIANPLAHWWRPEEVPVGERVRERVSPRAEVLEATPSAQRRRATAALRFNAPSAAMPTTARCRTTLSPTPPPLAGEGLEAVTVLV